MIPAFANAPAGPCPIVASLVALFGETFGESRDAFERITGRLDRIEYEARWQGAHDETFLAIRAARLLLASPILPPPPRRVGATRAVVPAR